MTCAEFLQTVCKRLRLSGDNSPLSAIFPLQSFPTLPRDWSVMRRRAAAKVQTNFIDIAPSPPFRRIVTFDDGMPGLAKMLGGVTVWRAVAAADMAARPAEAQMHPRRTKFQTFLASERARRYITDGVVTPLRLAVPLAVR